MSKKKKGEEKHGYAEALHDLQVELVKFQRQLIKAGERVLVIFEGRDTAGKDGTIRHITEHLSPRDTRVVALGTPSSRETTEWYFQRWVPHLPAGGEFVLFNRSWYNRAGVERVMGFCTEAQVEDFMRAAPTFEQLLIDSGLTFFKYYLDITKDEQKERLEDRHRDPLKQWKLSPIDAAAPKHWDDYSRARNDMFRRTHTPASPWHVVRADDKHTARLNIARDLLSRLDYKDKDEALCAPDPDIVFPFQEAALKKGLIAP